MVTIHGLGAAGVLDSVVTASIPALVTDIKFRTAFSAETTLATSQDLIRMYQSTGESSPSASARVLRAIRPTFTINSPAFGQKVFAPYGEATPGEGEANVSKLKLAAALMAVGFLGLGVTAVLLIRE